MPLSDATGRRLREGFNIAEYAKRRLSRREFGFRVSGRGLLCGLVAGIALAGCGGSSPSTDRASITPTPTPAPTPTPQPQPVVNLQTDRGDLLWGQSATLAWNTQNATALVSSNFGAAVLNGSATVTPSETTTYTLTVRNDGGQTAVGSVAVRVSPVTVTVTPSPAAVNVGESVTLTAQVGGAVDTRVTWSVQESGGGSITADGVYTAPAAAGVYHIQAASVADTRKSAVTEIRVRAASGTITID